jgi:hypothetical protein
MRTIDIFKEKNKPEKKKCITVFLYWHKENLSIVILENPEKNMQHTDDGKLELIKKKLPNDSWVAIIGEREELRREWIMLSMYKKGKKSYNKVRNEFDAEK